MTLKRVPVWTYERLRLYFRVARRSLRKIWQQARDRSQIRSEKWTWLREEPISLEVLNRKLWRASNATINYSVRTGVSAIIATVGLLTDSTATIIGAMIVAPLMGPISSMAFALSLGNRQLLKHAFISLFIGVLITVSLAYSIALLSELHSFNEEIVSRVQPTLLDLIVALAAGAAGAFAISKSSVADALPGVAIAVALAPPLCVVGIGIAMGSSLVFQGAGLLFLTNLAGILFSGTLVFIWQEYGTLKKAQRALVVTSISILLLGLPLGLSLRELVTEAKARNLVNVLIRRQTVTFKDTQIRTLRVDTRGEILAIRLEVAAPRGRINQNQVQLVRSFLEKRLERSVRLDVRVLPVEEFLAPPSENTEF
ncbi:MAG: DUF389 domain-containing protein [Cyanobacteria bacterium P01_C01_bin.89]